MKEQISEALLGVIEKNLPKQNGELVMKRLQECLELEKKVMSLEETINNLLTEDEKKLEIIQNWEKRERSLFQRENLVSQRETEYQSKSSELAKEQEKWKSWKLEVELNATRQTNSDIKEITMGLVRNTEFKKTVFNTKHWDGGVYSSTTGEYHDRKPISDDTTITEQAE